MSFVTAPYRGPSPDLVNRRLVSGMLLSIVIHALVLSLQFGTPGLGLPVPMEPIKVRIAQLEPHALPALPDLPAQPDPPPPPPPPPPRPEAVTGMTLLDPVPRPRPAAPTPLARKKKPIQSRRISSPMPAQPVEAPRRVIAQDQNQNQFVVPMARPEEALQKSIDPKEAQHGTDEGTENTTALLETDIATESEALVQAQAAAGKAEQLAAAQRREETAAALALQAKRAEQAQAQQLAAEQAQAQQLAAEQALRERQAALALEDSRRRQAELAEQQQAAALALLEAEAAQQQALRQAALRVEAARAEQLRREEQQRKERELALELEARRVAEEQAQQQAARRQAEQLAARQKADELAARQQAEQAALQREQDRAAAQSPAAAGAATAGPAGSPDGSGTRAVVPSNLFSSDLVNRARAASRGLDILSGIPPRPRPDQERGRRRAIVGAAERDVPLRMYVDSWRQKIERNGNLNYAQARDRARIDPLVSVAIRSDGSVEEVTLIRSTGRAEMDEAVRRIVRLNARYAVFPPNIAARYDVIEIRRIWNFEETLKLLEEMR